ncbi:MAG: cell division protein SepF [Clostridia bacterium]|nr:cell division protein SepF [Clostridia bacterium]
MSFFQEKMSSILSYLENKDEDEDILINTVKEKERDYQKRSNVNVVTNTKKGKIVDIHATTQLQVVVIKTQRFEDVQEIAVHLKERKPVVVNMEETPPDVARRILDFVTGVIYAIDGSVQKISKVILLATPYNVNIMGNFEDELRNGIFPWD